MQARQAKVAWVTPRLGRNGNLLYMGPLLKGISSACRQFRVFTVEYDGGSNNAGFDITHTGSINQVTRDITSDGIPLNFSLVSPAIIPRLYRYKPDLLILNEFGMLTMYGILLSYILRRSKILLIVENRPVKVGSLMSKRIRRLIRRLIVRKADAILTNNADGKTYLIEEVGVDESRIISRPYLISDMSQFINIADDSNPTHKIHDNKEPVRFLFVGRLIESKGLQHALEAFQHLMNKQPGKFLFDIVGDGPYRSVLESQAQQLGLQDHVCFHGQQAYDGLADLYRRADIFLFPTLMDYRSLVCFEAMSVGLPILASIHDGGSVETVSEGKNGYTFDPREYLKLAELLSRFIEQPELIGQFSEKSTEMSRAYTLPRAVESVVIACDLALTDARS